MSCTIKFQKGHCCWKLKLMSVLLSSARNASCPEVSTLINGTSCVNGFCLSGAGQCGCSPGYYYNASIDQCVGKYVSWQYGLFFLFLGTECRNEVTVWLWWVHWIQLSARFFASSIDLRAFRPNHNKSLLSNLAGLTPLSIKSGNVKTYCSATRQSLFSIDQC